MCQNLGSSIPVHPIDLTVQFIAFVMPTHIYESLRQSLCYLEVPRDKYDCHSPKVKHNRQVAGNLTEWLGAAHDSSWFFEVFCTLGWWCSPWLPTGLPAYRCTSSPSVVLLYLPAPCIMSVRKYLLSCCLQ